MNEKIFVIPEEGISNPIKINPELCSGCNKCVETCQVDVFLPNPVKHKPPIVTYPGECWYCGCCVMECPCSGAIILNSLSMNKVNWIQKNSITKEK